MMNLFSHIFGMWNILDILEQMEKNRPNPSSTSKKLWKLRHATHIKPDSKRSETMLEKSVAMLASNGHLPGWFNQCPTASGIGDSNRNRHSNVDLVRWNPADASAWLMELKWGANTPCEAIQQILGYGAAYLYCRKYRDQLPVGDRLIMDARHITLSVVAPRHYYKKAQDLENFFARAKRGVEQLNAESPIKGLTLSIEVVAFNESFRILPFATGAEVKESCNRVDLTDTGRQIRDAFDGLVQICA